MMLKKRAVEAQLTGKLRCEVENGAHKVFLLKANDRYVAKTHTSNGADEDLGDRLIAAMAKQMKVSKPTFVGVVNCSKSRDECIAEMWTHPDCAPFAPPPQVPPPRQQ